MHFPISMSFIYLLQESIQFLFLSARVIKLTDYSVHLDFLLLNLFIVWLSVDSPIIPGIEMLIHCELCFPQWLIPLSLSEPYFDSFGVTVRDGLLVIDYYCMRAGTLLFWFGTPSKSVCNFPSFEVIIA